MQVIPLYAFAISLDLLKWSNMRSRSGSKKTTGSRSSTAEKELIVYHMRSQHEKSTGEGRGNDACSLISHIFSYLIVL
jgi:hypothetical protein